MVYKIKVEDMHCENCVKRIENALSQTGIKFDSIIIIAFRSFELGLLE